MTAKDRIVRSVSVNSVDHPNLYQAITVGDNVTSAEFPNASHFMAQAAEEKLAAQNVEGITNGELLEELKQLRQIIENLRVAGPPEVQEKINQAKNKMKLAKGKR